jgi:hypothetical protein
MTLFHILHTPYTSRITITESFDVLAKEQKAMKTIKEILLDHSPVSRKRVLKYLFDLNNN